MTIAEKLIRQKQDFDDVYEAGKASMVDESKIITKTVYGSFIHLDNVSEIPHKVKIKASSKNLLNMASFIKSSSAISNSDVNYDGTSIRFERINDSANLPSIGWSIGDCADLFGKTFTLSFDFDEMGGADTHTRFSVNILCGNPFITTNIVNLKAIGYATTEQKGRKELSFTVTEQLVGSPLFIRFYMNYAKSAGDYIKISNVQLEKGEKATHYTPYVSGMSEVKLYTQGGNLTPYPYSFIEKTVSGTAFKVNEDGSVEVRGTPSENVAIPISANRIDVTPFRGKQLSISFTDWSWYYFVHIMFDDGTWQYNFLSSRRDTTLTNTVPNNATQIQIGVGTLTEFDGSTQTIYPQLCVGDQVGKYEPYKCKTITIKADDSLVETDSISPYMNTFTDTEGLNIELTYNKSWGMQTEYDRFWDNYFHYRTTVPIYEYMFAGWTKHLIHPNQDIHPTTAKGMFYHTNIREDFLEWTKKLGIVIDLTNITNTQGFDLAFRNSQFTRLGVLNASKCTQLSETFWSAQYLVTIDKLILNNQGTISFYTTTFRYCYALENLTIEGVIGKKDFNLQWSTKLSHDSIVSIINALSTTTSGIAVTFSKTAVNTAFETSVGAGDGSTSEEWLALVNTKINWTINLV